MTLGAFFKNHWLGIFLTSVLASLAATYIYNHWFSGLPAAQASFPSSKTSSVPLPGQVPGDRAKVSEVTRAAVPSPLSRVTDPAGFLSPEVRNAVDAKLTKYEIRTGHQVLVWIGSSTRGEPIEAFATRTFNAWEVGRRNINDGAIIFVFGDDRQVRIELGLGLEERVPHDTAARIIQQVMIPRLQAGDHNGAINQGVNATLRAIDGDPWEEIVKELGTAAPRAENHRENH